MGYHNPCYLELENEHHNLIVSKYEKYLDAFPDGACSDSVWKKYALCLKEYLTYMQEHYIHEDDLEDLMEDYVSDHYDEIIEEYRDSYSEYTPGVPMRYQ